MPCFAQTDAQADADGWLVVVDAPVHTAHSIQPAKLWNTTRYHMLLLCVQSCTQVAPQAVRLWLHMQPVRQRQQPCALRRSPCELRDEAAHLRRHVEHHTCRRSSRATTRSAGWSEACADQLCSTHCQQPTKGPQSQLPVPQAHSADHAPCGRARTPARLTAARVHCHTHGSTCTQCALPHTRQHLYPVLQRLGPPGPSPPLAGAAAAAGAGGNGECIAGPLLWLS